MRNLWRKMDTPTVVLSTFWADLMDTPQTADTSIFKAPADVHCFFLARNGEGEWKVRKHGYSKRRTWRKVHLGLDVKTGQIRAALMTHQDVDDASALSSLLAQIPANEPIDTIGRDGAYDTKQCHKVIAGRGATPSIPPRQGAKPWSEGTPGASWRNEAIDDIARDGRGEWKKRSGYHRRSLIENTMYRYKTLTGNCLSARCIGSQATEVAIRVGIVNHMVTLARPQSVRIS